LAQDGIQFLRRRIPVPVACEKAQVDHFMFSEGNTLVVNLVHNWLNKHFPAKA